MFFEGSGSKILGTIVQICEVDGTIIEWEPNLKYALWNHVDRFNLVETAATPQNIFVTQIGDFTGQNKLI